MNQYQKINSPRILFWGTSEFALPSLEMLLLSGYNVIGVVTTPDMLSGRKNTLTPPPTKVFAEGKDIPVYQPPTIKSQTGSLLIPEADLAIVAAYGKIIPREIIDSFKLGVLNIHPSLLPRWRGPSPIQFTILNGDEETGVTIIKMDEKMDHGPIVAISNFQFPISKLTYPELREMLAKEGAKLLIDTLPKWINGEITPTTQNELKVTFSKILKKQDGRINWKEPAIEIERQIRAFTPWPSSWTLWKRKDREQRLRIDEARESKKEISLNPSPGFVERIGDALFVATGKGFLEIKKLTPEGGKTIDTAAFLRGNKEIVGAMLN